MPDAPRTHSELRDKAWSRIDSTKTEDMVPASELRGWLANYVDLEEQYENLRALNEEAQQRLDEEIVANAKLEEQLEALRKSRERNVGRMNRWRSRAGHAERERDWWRERYLLDVTPDAGQVARLDYEAAEFADSSPATTPRNADLVEAQNTDSDVCHNEASSPAKRRGRCGECGGDFGGGYRGCQCEDGPKPYPASEPETFRITPGQEKTLAEAARRESSREREQS